MKTFGQQKYLLPLILAAGIAVLLSISDRDPIHHKESSERLEHNFYECLEGVANHTYQGPYVYRILIPISITFINHVVPSVDGLTIDFAFTVIFLWLCQIAFFSYQRLFFKPTESFLGVVLLDVLLGCSLIQMQGPTLIETADILNLLVFILAFILIYLKYFKSFCIILIFGTLNRETTLFLPLVFLVVNGINRKSLYQTFIALLAVAIPYFALHLLIHPPVSSWVTFDAISLNIPFLDRSKIFRVLSANIHLLILLGPLALIALYKFPNHPKFLKSVSFIVLPFVVLHYIVGAIIEERLWMPMYIILIPLAVDTLVKIFQEETSNHNILT